MHRMSEGCLADLAIRGLDNSTHEMNHPRHHRQNRPQRSTEALRECYLSSLAGRVRWHLLLSSENVFPGSSPIWSSVILRTQTQS